MENLHHCLGNIDEMNRFGELYGCGEDLVQHRGYWLPETYPGGYSSEERSNLWKFHPRGIMVFNAETMTVETYEVFNFKMTVKGAKEAEQEFDRMLPILDNGRDNEFRFGDPPLELYGKFLHLPEYRQICGPWVAAFMKAKWNLNVNPDAYPALSTK